MGKRKSKVNILIAGLLFLTALLIVILALIVSGPGRTASGGMDDAALQPGPGAADEAGLDNNAAVPGEAGASAGSFDKGSGFDEAGTATDSGSSGGDADSQESGPGAPMGQELSGESRLKAGEDDYAKATQKSAWQGKAIRNPSTDEDGLVAMAGLLSRKASARKREKSLYFIIDDAGYNLENLRPFLDFPGKLTIAVLPGLEYSEKSAKLALSRGKKVILHQPMEALSGNNTGPDAIMLGMEKTEVRKVLEKNIDSLPGIAGMNNHMGSAVTADRSIMESVLLVMRERGLVFIDSLTTPESVAKDVALKLGIAIEQRDIFLDNVDNREAIMESINMGRQTAENKGYAVMIGHVWSSELADTMMQIYPNLIEEGFTLKDASDFLLSEE